MYFIEVDTEYFEEFLTKNMELCKGLLVSRDLSFVDQKKWGDTAEDVLCKEIAIKIKCKIDIINSIVNEKKDIEVLEADPITKIVHHYVEKALPTAKAWLNDNYHKYSLDINLMDVIKCVKRLREGIPPNVTSEKYIYSQTIQNVQNIMVAGCLFKETHIPPASFDSGEEMIDQLDKLNQLMLKAIELSQVHEGFQKYFENIDQTYKYKRILFRRFQ